MEQNYDNGSIIRSNWVQFLDAFTSISSTFVGGMKILSVSNSSFLLYWSGYADEYFPFMFGKYNVNYFI